VAGNAQLVGEAVAHRGGAGRALHVHQEKDMNKVSKRLGTRRGALTVNPSMQMHALPLHCNRETKRAQDECFFRFPVERCKQVEDPTFPLRLQKSRSPQLPAGLKSCQREKGRRRGKETREQNKKSEQTQFRQQRTGLPTMIGLEQSLPETCHQYRTNENQQGDS
jgi:hypothetical protein